MITKVMLHLTFYSFTKKHSHCLSLNRSHDWYFSEWEMHPIRLYLSVIALTIHDTHPSVLSPIAVVLYLSLKYLPLFACVNAPVLEMGHILGLLYSCIMWALKCLNYHTHTRVYQFTVLSLLPSWGVNEIILVQLSSQWVGNETWKLRL